MKIALFVLGVLAFAQGIHLEGNSSMVVEYDFEEDEPGQACITPPCGVVALRNFCHGFAEIRSEFNGVETKHGKMIKDEGEDAPKKAARMRYRAPGGRNARNIIEVQGNCCWKFYKRYDISSFM